MRHSNITLGLSLVTSTLITPCPLLNYNDWFLFGFLHTGVRMSFSKFRSDHTHSLLFKSFHGFEMVLGKDTAPYCGPASSASYPSPLSWHHLTPTSSLFSHRLYPYPYHHSLLHLHWPHSQPLLLPYSSLHKTFSGAIFCTKKTSPSAFFCCCFSS